MNHTELSPHAARRFAMVTLLLVFLGAVGCMTGRQAVMSADRGDVTGASGYMSNPGQSACSEFVCEP